MYLGHFCFCINRVIFVVRKYFVLNNYVSGSNFFRTFAMYHASYLQNMTFLNDEMMRVF